MMFLEIAGLAKMTKLTINMPTLAESQLLKRISELESEVEKLKLSAAADKKQRRKLQNENSRLRAITGACVRSSKKNSCIEQYKDGMTGSQLAAVAKCGVRYANQIIKIISGR